MELEKELLYSIVVRNLLLLLRIWLLHCNRYLKPLVSHYSWACGRVKQTTMEGYAHTCLCVLTLAGTSLFRDWGIKVWVNLEDSHWAAPRQREPRLFKSHHNWIDEFSAVCVLGLHGFCWMGDYDYILIFILIRAVEACPGHPCCSPRCECIIGSNYVSTLVASYARMIVTSWARPLIVTLSVVATSLLMIYLLNRGLCKGSISNHRRTICTLVCAAIVYLARWRLLHPVPLTGFRDSTCVSVLICSVFSILLYICLSSIYSEPNPW